MALLHPLTLLTAMVLGENLGIEAPMVSQRLGHSRTSTTTDIYAHIHSLAWPACGADS
jgi:hypothetical protein